MKAQRTNPKLKNKQFVPGQNVDREGNMKAMAHNFRVADEEKYNAEGILFAKWYIAGQLVGDNTEALKAVRKNIGDLGYFSGLYEMLPGNNLTKIQQKLDSNDDTYRELRRKIKEADPDKFYEQLKIIPDRRKIDYYLLMMELYL